MKNLLIIIALISFSALSFAQKTYLKIQTGNSSKSIVMYPPGTNFELKTKEGLIVMKPNDRARTLKINNDYLLTVYPNYKKEPDIYKLDTGTVELALTKDFFKKTLKHNASKKQEPTYCTQNSF